MEKKRGFNTFFYTSTVIGLILNYAYGQIIQYNSRGRGAFTYLGLDRIIGLISVAILVVLYLLMFRGKTKKELTKSACVMSGYCLFVAVIDIFFINMIPLSMMEFYNIISGPAILYRWATNLILTMPIISNIYYFICETFNYVNWAGWFFIIILTVCLPFTILLMPKKKETNENIDSVKKPASTYTVPIGDQLIKSNTSTNSQYTTDPYKPPKSKPNSDLGSGLSGNDKGDLFDLGKDSDRKFF